MGSAIIVLVIGILLVFIGRVLWKKGDYKESVWLTIVYAFADIFSGNFFNSFRGFAVILYITAFIMIVLSILYLVGVVKVIS